MNFLYILRHLTNLTFNEIMAKLMVHFDYTFSIKLLYYVLFSFVYVMEDEFILINFIHF